MIFVRTGNEFILFDMDFAKLKIFLLPTSNRILKSRYIENIDDIKQLIFASIKGDIIVY
jgi:hypothetical protein